MYREKLQKLAGIVNEKDAGSVEKIDNLTFKRWSIAEISLNNVTANGSLIGLVICFNSLVWMKAPEVPDLFEGGYALFGFFYVYST